MERQIGSKKNSWLSIRTYVRNWYFEQKIINYYYYYIGKSKWITKTF